MDQVTVLEVSTNVVEVAVQGPQGPTGPQGIQGPQGTTDYNELQNKPTLGTAASHAATDFATAAQGYKADTAMQPNVYDPDGVNANAFDSVNSRFVQNHAGVTVRSVANKLYECVSLLDFGVSELVDNTAAIAAAAATGAVIFINPGIYPTTLDASSLPERMYGFGQIKDSSGNNRAPWFIYEGASPTMLGDQTSIQTAFSGDLSYTAIALEKRIDGSATLGSPTTGYMQNPENAAIMVWGLNSSGHNESLSGNDGRTGSSLFDIRLTNNGQGDYSGIFINATASGVQAGATSFLANSAAILINGQTFANAAHVYLNNVELNSNDNGHDAAAVTMVANLYRSVSTAALGEVWMFMRAQSVGTVAADVAYSASGLWKRGLDLTKVTFDTDNAALSLAANSRIYMNAVASGIAVQWGQTLNTQYLEYSSVLGAFNFAMNGASLLQLTSASSSVNGFKMSGVVTGNSPILDAAGSDTNIGLYYRTKGTGTHQFNAAGGIQMVVRSAVSNPVNYVGISGSTAGNVVAINALGADTNLGISIIPKGTGVSALADSSGAIKVAANTTGIGFFATSPIAKPTITGSKGANAALTSLLTALAAFGLLTDSTT